MSKTQNPLSQSKPYTASSATGKRRRNIGQFNLTTEQEGTKTAMSMSRNS